MFNLRIFLTFLFNFLKKSECNRGYSNKISRIKRIGSNWGYREYGESRIRNPRIRRFDCSNILARNFISSSRINIDCRYQRL